MKIEYPGGPRVPAKPPPLTSSAPPATSGQLPTPPVDKTVDTVE